MNNQSSLKEFCKAYGSEILLPTTYRILLHDTAHAYFIEEGNISVYFLFNPSENIDFYEVLAQESTTLMSDLIEGALHFSGYSESGDFLFPFLLNRSSPSLALAVANMNSKIWKISLENITQYSFANSEFDQQVLLSIKKWITSHSGQYKHLKPKKISGFFDKDKVIFAEKRSIVAIPHYQYYSYPNQLWTMKILRGSASLFHFKNLPVDADNTPFLLTLGIWISAATDLEIQTEMIVNAYDPRIWLVLNRHNEFINIIAHQNLHYKLLYDKYASEKIKQREKELLQKGVHILGSVLSPNEMYLHVDESDDSIIKTITFISHFLRKDTRLPKYTTFREHEPPAEFAKSVCITGNLFCRQIKLPKDWKKFSIPLLAFTEAEANPIAAIPSENGYKLFDANLKQIDEAKGANIGTTALAFYRSFPNKLRLSFFDIFKFAIKWVKKEIFAVLVAGICLSVAAFAYPFAIEVIFDKVVHSSDYMLLAQVMAALITIEVAKVLFQIAQEYAILRLETYLDHDMETAMWQRLLQMPAAFFKKFQTGVLMERISSFRTVRKAISGSVTRITLQAFFSFLFMIVMFFYSPSLTFITLAVFAVYFIFLGFLVPKAIKIYGKIQDLSSELNASIIEIVLGISKIRTNGAENRIFYHWSRREAAVQTQELKMGFISSVNSLFNSGIPYLLQILIFSVFIFWSESYQSMSIGSFLAFYAALTSFSNGLLSLSNILFFTLPVIPTWKRGEVILKEPTEGNYEKKIPGNLRGNINIESLYFRYEDSPAYVIRDFSLKVEEGEFVAIIGQSGCGKSTLVRLLLGFEEPHQGAIYYDGHNLSKLNKLLLRRQLGVFLQHSSILDGTIEENILCGNYATKKEIMEAVEMAGFAEDIANMPMGFKTVLSSGGMTLSGGQKQRLMLARTLIAKHKILILDEATNALDNRTQKIVTHNIERLEVTRIIIAHRLSSVKNANRIVIMERGRIVEQGNYQDLLENSLRFKEFVNLQNLDER